MGYIGNQPAETPVVEILETDFKIGEDDQTKIDFADANTINFHANNAKEMVLVENSLSPGTSDGTALGTTSLMWSDLFLASGSVINLNNGNVTITHSSNTLTVAAATVAFTASTAVTVSNDLKLSSDSAILSLGADDDATLTHDGTTGLTIAANPFEVDSGGNITLDAHTGIFIFQDANSEVLRITEGNSGDVTIKLETNAKDLIFTDNGDAEGFRIKDAAGGVVTTLVTTAGTADHQGVVVTAANSAADDALGNQKGIGVIAVMRAKTGIAIGELLHIDGDGDLDEAHADATADMPAVAIALEANSTGSDANIKVLLQGFYRDDSQFSFSSVGAAVFTDHSTEGDFTQSASSTDGHFIQKVGIAATDDMIYFSPSLDTIEHA